MSLLMNNVIEPDCIVQKNLGDDQCSSSLRILNILLYNLTMSCAEPVQSEDSLLLQNRCTIINQPSCEKFVSKEQCLHPANSAHHDIHSAKDNSVTCDPDVTKFNRSLENAMVELFGVNYRAKINNGSQNFSEAKKSNNINHAHWYSLASLFSGRLTKTQNYSSTLTNKC